jgi:sigma-B regulation protein RsbU (phosphoserine phosphatase)
MELTAERKYELLLDISHKVRDTLDLNDIMEHMLDAVKSILDYDAAGIFVLNQDLVRGRHETSLGVIAGIARRGFDPNPPEGDDMLMRGQGIIGYVIQQGKPVVVQDVRLDPRYFPGRRATLSEITVPIIRNNRAIGALNLESDRVAVYQPQDVEVLQFFADAAAISIEKGMLHKQLLEQVLVNKQLETAREVQSRLLPNKPPELAGYDIAGICIPTDDIGGDYFDYIPLSQQDLGLAVADVSGHGISSALVMTAFRALLRTKARGQSKPAQIAHSINQLLPEFTGDNHFVTILYAVLEADTGKLTYISCGHPPPLILRAGGEVAKLNKHNPALGIFEDLHFVDETSSLEEGDILVLYTDGVVEIMNQDGQSFGLQRLVDVIREHQHETATEIIYQVIRATESYSEHYGFLDDFTLVVIRREVAQQEKEVNRELPKPG